MLGDKLLQNNKSNKSRLIMKEAILEGMSEYDGQLSPLDAASKDPNVLDNKKKDSVDELSTEVQHDYEGIIQPVANFPCSRTRAVCHVCLSGKNCRIVRSRTLKMDTLIKENKPHEAQSIFNGIIEEGHKPSLMTSTTLLAALTAQKQFKFIPSLVSLVEENGMKPDSIFFNAVINAYCEAGKIDEAMNTLSKMKVSGCEPTTSTFNTLIKGYGIIGKPEESKKLLDMMLLEENIRPDVKTYNILIKAWCDQQNLAEAWNAIYKMRDSGLRPDIVTYNTIAKAYANSGETKKAEDLISDIQIKLRPNERTLAIIIVGYCKEGNMSAALRCVHRMKNSGVRPNIIMFNSLIKGFLDAEDTAGVDEVLALMKELGIKPDIVTYSHQINAWGAKGMMTKCLENFNAMVEAGIEADSQAYSILAKGYVRAREPDKAEALLETMEERGIRPNVVTFTTIISGWCSAANMENAMRIYRKMCESGVAPNLKTFETLIWGFGEVKQPWRSEEMLQVMREVGVSPRRNTFRLVAEAWCAVGLQDEANRVIFSLEDRQKTPLSDQRDDSLPESFERVHQSQNLGATYGNAKADTGITVPKMVLQDAEVTAELLTASTKSSIHWRSCGFGIRPSIVCRNQSLVHGNYGFSSCKVVLPELRKAVPVTCFGI